MSQTSGPQSPSEPAQSPSPDFGANEWLVDEMFEQYQKDPGSVSPEWAKYFKSNGATNGTTYRVGRPESAPTPATKAAEKPSRPAKQAEKAAEKPAEKADEKPAAEGDEKKAGDKKEAGPTPVAKPRPDAQAAEPAKGTSAPVAKDARPAAQAAASDEPTYTTHARHRGRAPSRTWTSH